MDFKDIKKVIRFIKGLTNYGFLNLEFARNKIKKENLPTLLQENFESIALFGYLYNEGYITFDEKEQKFRLDVYKLTGTIIEGGTGDFSGKITATSGYIGTESDGWVINSSNLNNGDVYIGTDLFSSGVKGISIDGNVGSDAHNYMATVSGNAYFELGDGSDKVLKYDSSTGNLTFKGGVFDGDITCNGTITGGTVQTSNSNKRVALVDSDNSLKIYNSGGNPVSLSGYDAGSQNPGLLIDKRTRISSGPSISPYFEFQYGQIVAVDGSSNVTSWSPTSLSLTDGYLDTDTVKINSTTIINSNGAIETPSGEDITSGGSIIANSGIENNGRHIKNTDAVSSSTYSITSTDHIILCDTSSNSITVTIPTAQTEDGRELVIKDYGGNSNTNNITVDTEGSETIDGESDITINTDYDSVTIICKNNDWYII